MFEVTTTARLADYTALAGEESVTAVLERSALEGALGADSPGIWLDVGYDDVVSRLSIALTPADIAAILRSSEGEQVTVALDAEAVVDVLDPPEVEAHGIRSALAIAVVAGAVAAPAGFAATPQVSMAGTSAQAAKSQVTRASAESQVSRAGARSQVSQQAAKSQVSRAAAKSQVSRATAKSQVSRATAKSQVSRASAQRQLAKSLVVKASGVQVLGVSR
jgi:hypothetical protein